MPPRKKLSIDKEHRREMYKGPSGRAKSHDTLPYVDYRILKLLPDVGTRVGLKEVGLNVKTLAKMLEAQGSDKDMISGRMIALKFLGYVTAVQLLPSYQGAGYQVTKLGREVILEYEREHPEEKID